MSIAVRWILGTLVAGIVLVVPIVHYRWTYAHSKRLRVVVPGVFYRSGSLTATGFAEAVHRHGIKTIVNLQDEFPDPDLPQDFLGTRSIEESKLCRQLGVRYVYIPPDLLPRKDLATHRPEAIDRFLRLLDEPGVFPVLIHCKAGLHRTGVLTAVYRMEHCGWTPAEAMEELLAHGFGRFAGTADNDYITQYVLSYQPGLRRTISGHGEQSRTALARENKP